MIARHPLPVCFALLTCVLGLLSARPASAAEAPFTAEAVEDGVILRAGRKHMYYKVGSLNKGDRVTVKEVVWGWYRIVPPEGVHSFISRGHVNATGDGSVGVVDVEQATVVAANQKGPDLSYAGQVDLSKGDEVEIVSTAGKNDGYYKIKPPQGAHVFVPAEQMRAVAEGEPGGGDAEPVAGQAGGSADATAADDSGGSSESSNPSESDQAAAATGGERQTAAEAESMLASADGTGSPAPSEMAGGDDASGGGSSQGQSGSSQSRESGQTAEGSDAAEAGDSSSNDTAADAGQGSQDEASGDNSPDAGSSSDSSLSSSSADAGDASDSEGDGSAADSGSGSEADADTAEGDLDSTKGAPVQTQAEAEALKKLERKMLPKFKLPLDKQPVEKMISQYQAIQQQDLSAYDQQIVKIRLSALKRNRKLKKTLQRIDQAESQAQARQAEEAEAEQARRDTLNRNQYDVVGKLEASSVYDGQNLPRLFRLVEPTSGYTLGYVEPSDVNTKQMLGSEIGIIGTRNRDRAMNLRIFDIERVDLLDKPTSAASTDSADSTDTAKADTADTDTAKKD